MTCHILDYNRDIGNRGHIQDQGKTAEYRAEKRVMGGKEMEGG